MQSLHDSHNLHKLIKFTHKYVALYLTPYIPSLRDNKDSKWSVLSLPLVQINNREGVPGLTGDRG